MNNLPIIGCASCATTLGRRGCHIHKDYPAADLLTAAIARAEKAEARVTELEAEMAIRDAEVAQALAIAGGVCMDKDERIAAFEAELAEERSQIRQYRKLLNQFLPPPVYQGGPAALSCPVQPEDIKAQKRPSADQGITTIEKLLQAQRVFSETAFGPGKRTQGITQHIQKELDEIRACPDDLEEWTDVLILALDGYWRHGGTPESVMTSLERKLAKNMLRIWPPISAEDVPVEHLRDSRCAECDEPGHSAQDCKNRPLV